MDQRNDAYLIGLAVSSYGNVDGVDDVLPTLAMARNGRAVYEALDELRNAEAGKDVTLDGPDEGTCPRESLLYLVLNAHRARVPQHVGLFCWKT